MDLFTVVVLERKIPVVTVTAECLSGILLLASAAIIVLAVARFTPRE
jgi:hypothetical protein